MEIKETGMIDKYLDFARELKKTVEHESDDDTNCSFCILNGTKSLGKILEELEIRGRDLPDHSIFMIG